MFHVMRKPCTLKAKHYAAQLFEINEGLGVFTGSYAGKILCRTQLNYVTYNSKCMGQSGFLRGFDFEAVIFNK